MSDTEFVREVREIQNWWTYLILGILFILLGFWIISNPKQSYVALAMFFAFIMLVAGVLHTIFSLANRHELAGWGVHLAMGLIDLVLGLLLLAHPQFMLRLLSLFMGLWLLFRSVNLIGAAFELRALGDLNWGWRFSFGVLALIFSGLIIIHPVIAGLTVVAWTAFAFMAVGVAYILLSLIFREFKISLDELNDME